jgi:hypothetical protein
VYRLAVAFSKEKSHDVLTAISKVAHEIVVIECDDISIWLGGIKSAAVTSSSTRGKTKDSTTKVILSCRVLVYAS